MNEAKALTIARRLKDADQRPEVLFFEDTEGTPRHSVTLRLQYADAALLRESLRLAEEEGVAVDVSCGAVPGAFALRFYEDFRPAMGEERAS